MKEVLIIGAGMITKDLILPSLYHLQRTGKIGAITVCATGSTHIRELADDKEILAAFPGQNFKQMPEYHQDPENRNPGLYRDALKKMAPRSIVVIAIPDQLHFEVLRDCLNAGQHILCVKPLVMTYRQAEEIRQKAYDLGLFVGIEYHKRFDRRALHARRMYRQGAFGEFVMAEAKLVEPYLYRNSNFQNWFTTENSDPFVYIGCHYVDQMVFITGILPTSVSVSGVQRKFPNGNDAYMWANGRVKFENGALLSVINGLGYPDDGAGSNEQNMTMFCEGDGKNGLIKHNDQFRGVSHSYVDAEGPGGSRFNFINPDFYRIVPWEGDG
ncbi:MAG: Gfo/Idh/MocA family oxidoreductase, partial [Spirochaetales bacterium]|nr:Gfo/Idh/MocA family oxidoreductase [Spirochaetales bacterium]